MPACCGTGGSPADPGGASQARNLAQPEPLPDSLEAMAMDDSDRLNAACPEGPYHLLGWSFGGLIAHAVAVGLERRGRRVGLLAMINSLPMSDVQQGAE